MPKILELQNTGSKEIQKDTPYMVTASTNPHHPRVLSFQMTWCQKCDRGLGVELAWQLIMDRLENLLSNMKAAMNASQE
jgi:hypothetical protein